MPVEEKTAKVKVDVYSITLGADSVSVAPVANMQNVSASFRYNAGVYQMIILVGIELGNGIAIIDYSDALDRVVVFDIYDNDGRVLEAIELGEYLNSKVMADMRTKIDGTLIKKVNPNAYVVDSYETSDGDIVTKLLPTDVKIGIYA